MTKKDVVYIKTGIKTFKKATHGFIFLIWLTGLISISCLMSNFHAPLGFIEYCLMCIFILAFSVVVTCFGSVIIGTPLFFVYMIFDSIYVTTKINRARKNKQTIEFI